MNCLWSAWKKGLWFFFMEWTVSQFFQLTATLQCQVIKGMQKGNFWWDKIIQVPWKLTNERLLCRLKLVSFNTSSVQIGSSAACPMSAAVLAHVVCSSRSDLDAVICKWNGLKQHVADTSFPQPYIHIPWHCNDGMSQLVYRFLYVSFGNLEWLKNLACFLNDIYR